jgi:hypothetical protein
VQNENLRKFERPISLGTPRIWAGYYKKFGKQEIQISKKFLVNLLGIVVGINESPPQISIDS